VARSIFVSAFIIHPSLTRCSLATAALRCVNCKKKASLGVGWSAWLGGIPDASGEER
jgi:hypothetical protein